MPEVQTSTITPSTATCPRSFMGPHMFVVWSNPLHWEYFAVWDNLSLFHQHISPLRLINSDGIAQLWPWDWALKRQRKTGKGDQGAFLKHFCWTQGGRNNFSFYFFSCTKNKHLPEVLHYSRCHRWLRRRMERELNSWGSHWERAMGKYVFLFPLSTQEVILKQKRQHKSLWD